MLKKSIDSWDIAKLDSLRVPIIQLSQYIIYYMQLRESVSILTQLAFWAEKFFVVEVSLGI